MPSHFHIYSFSLFFPLSFLLLGHYLFPLTLLLIIDKTFGTSWISPSRMAYLRLGSKSEAFHREGQTWICTTGHLQSDVTVEIRDVYFNLHKFPLMSRSGLLEKLIEEQCVEDGSACTITLNDIPGGAKTFEVVAKFCYGVKIELHALNAVSVRCAAEYLHMTEDYGDENLIALMEEFLNEVFANWTDTIKALETCEEVGPYAEELHIVARCIDSLATKSVTDPSLFLISSSEQSSLRGQGNILWSRLPSESKPQPIGEDWWFEDVSLLNLPSYKQLILAIQAKGAKPETVAASLIHYANKYIPSMKRQSSFNSANSMSSGTTVSASTENDQRVLLEELVALLPNKKRITSSKFLLRLLRTAMVLHANASCRESLERRIGEQMEEAVLVDLLIPNMGYTVETLYDIDCVQRILDHFVSVHQEAALSTPVRITEEGQYVNNNDSFTPMTMVANLVDGFLAEVAPDVNLRLPKFEALAAAIPEYARPLDDGIYRAIDVYLKAHPWLTDSEREQLCRLMNCQRLSLEASTHAAQNERLPLRVIVQVLFFEQLRLRTSISGWFFVSENLDGTKNPTANLELPTTGSGQGKKAACHDMRERVSELEKECMNMKQELQKIAKTRKSWNLFTKRFRFLLKSQPNNSANWKEQAAAPVNGQQASVNTGLQPTSS